MAVLADASVFLSRGRAGVASFAGVDLPSLSLSCVVTPPRALAKSPRGGAARAADNDAAGETLAPVESLDVAITSGSSALTDCSIRVSDPEAHSAGRGVLFPTAPLSFVEALGFSPTSVEEYLPLLSRDEPAAASDEVAAATQLAEPGTPLPEPEAARRASSSINRLDRKRAMSSCGV